MTPERTIAPGHIEGFIAGCPFCTAKRKGVPEVGSRFRVLTGSLAGRTGTVLKIPEKYSLDPFEIFCHLDENEPNIQTRIVINHWLIQLLPEPPIPDWAPPLSIQDAASLDSAVVNFCQKSFSSNKSEPNIPAFYELINVIWRNRLPLQPSELLSVLRAHGLPGQFDQELLKIYEHGINLLVYANGKKPIKRKRVAPFSCE